MHPGLIRGIVAPKLNGVYDKMARFIIKRYWGLGFGLGVILSLGLSGCGLITPLQSFNQPADCRAQMIAATPEAYLSNFSTVVTRELERVDVYITAKTRPSFWSQAKGLDHYHCVYTAGAATSADRQLAPNPPRSSGVVDDSAKQTAKPKE
ncbi:MAG: hypothetical protein ORO03_10310 [Alphaproteobacteria bacterium]|nr:hypothetical protein [Alphaproteobacteria bacterium]